MSYVLNAESERALLGVHPDLVRVVRRAIQITRADFRVFEGVRSHERQAKLFASGASTVKTSRHEVGADGYGHAVDLVPLLDLNGDGKPELRWDWPMIYKIADAMRAACVELTVLVRWGGVWDVPLRNLSSDLEHEVASYVSRRRAVGQKAFTDGPHFELPSSSYP